MSQINICKATNIANVSLKCNCSAKYCIGESDEQIDLIVNVNLFENGAHQFSTGPTAASLQR